MIQYMRIERGDFVNNLVMAYIGDAVYELYVRDYLIKKGIANVKLLQKNSVNLVSAKAQVVILNILIENKILTDEEVDIVKRGRNSKSHKSKTTDIITYKNSTGFECLIGNLYYKDKSRLEYIIEEVFKIYENLW